MIVNGSLSYASRPSVFQSWHPENSLLHNALLALITTIISFQASSILIDLFFGCKAPGKTTAADIQILCLVRKASPRSVMRSLFPKTFSNLKRRLPFIESVPTTTSTPEIPTSIPAKVVLRLFFLLFAIPLINIIILVLVFDRERNISFSKASFGGVGFGPSRAYGLVNTTRVSVNCQEYRLSLHPSDVAAVSFSMCDSLVTSKDPISPTMALTRIEVSGAFMKYTISTPNKAAYVSRVATLSLDQPETNSGSGKDDGLYFLHHAFTENATRWFLESTLSLVGKYLCHENSTTLPKVPVPTPDPSYELAQQLAIPCIYTKPAFSSTKTPEVNFVAILAHRITLVETKKFLVTTDTPVLQSRNATKNFVDARRMVMIKRRGTFASFLGLLVACVVIVAVRLVVLGTTRNDVETGFGLVAREVLGLPCCDSMLVHPDILVNYVGALLVHDTDILGT